MRQQERRVCLKDVDKRRECVCKTRFLSRAEVSRDACLNLGKGWSQRAGSLGLLKERGPRSRGKGANTRKTHSSKGHASLGHAHTFKIQRVAPLFKTVARVERERERVARARRRPTRRSEPSRTFGQCSEIPRTARNALGPLVVETRKALSHPRPNTESSKRRFARDGDFAAATCGETVALAPEKHLTPFAILTAAPSRALERETRQTDGTDRRRERERERESLETRWRLGATGPSLRVLLLLSSLPFDHTLSLSRVSTRDARERERFCGAQSPAAAAAANR